MKTKQTILLLLAVLLSGCASFENQSQNKILNYYHSVPQLDGIYWGIGSGLSINEASENSRLDISKQIYSKVYEKIIRNTEIIDNGSEISSKDVLIVKAELETDTILTNVKRLDYKIGNDGIIYVLSYLNINSDIYLDESIILAKLNNSYNIKKNFKILSSAIVPGSGQLIDKYYLEGSLFAGTALASIFGVIYGFNMMGSTYQDYMAAENFSVQQYYYSQWEDYRMQTIMSGSLYLATSIISALNYGSKTF